MIQSEINRYDRRYCDVYHLFYVVSKLRILKLVGSIRFIYRKTRDNNMKPTTSEMLSQQFMQSNYDERLINLYKMFEHDRGSPAFFEAKKRELFAMMRIFLTLSSADTKWKELIRILKKTVDNEEISDSEILSLPYPERCRLINTDPITCARYFNHKLHCIMK